MGGVMRPFCCLLPSLLLVFLSVSSCSKSQRAPKGDEKVLLGAPIGNRDNAPPTVRFDLRSVTTPATSSTEYLYECTYVARGKTARFRLELRYGALHGDLPMASADGKFLAAPGSDNTALLEDLKTALEAKQLPVNTKRVRELPFDAVVLGEKQSENAGGGFADKPPGDWVVVKLFLPKGGDDGEVFLNLNPVLGKGEFSIKDEDYGDFVVQELARVL
jgi:hypothetical protein